MRHAADGAPAAQQTEVYEIEPGALDEMFTAPRWLRDLGLASWLIVGFVLLVAGVVALLAITSTIVVPLILGGVLAAVGGPLVRRLQGLGMPRGIAAALVLLLLVALAVGVVLMVLGGLASQSEGIKHGMDAALDQVESWLGSLGIEQGAVKSELRSAIPAAGDALVDGVVGAIDVLKSVALLFTFTVFSTFFFLKDGPSIRAWAERNMGVPPSIARIVAGDTLRSVRAYFLGVTIVGIYNAVAIGLAALALGVPLPGTIAVVTLIAGYVPFLGAWVAGIFAFALALADSGTSTALTIAAIIFLVNGPLQQIVQPLAMGATLRLNPLVVLASTIAGGALFGMVGLVLSAPLTSAAVNIHAHVREAQGTGDEPPAAAAGG